MELSKDKIYFKYLTEYRAIILCLALFIIFPLLSRRFLSVGNIFQVLMNATVQAVIVCGQAMVIIGGGIDLSVGSLMLLCAMFTAKLVVGNALHPILIILTVLAIGALGGLVNGVLSIKVKINPFIVTLSMMGIFKGLTLIITKGHNIAWVNAPWFTIIGQGKPFGIPISILIVITVGIIPSIILTRKTIFGRGLYALGGNHKVAWLSGIRVDRISIMTYVLTGVFVAVGALIMVSRIESYTPNLGVGLELETILAAVIGGVSLLGGRGNILGAILGVVFVSFLRNGLLIVGVNFYVETIIIGIVFIAVLALDRIVQQNFQI